MKHALFLESLLPEVYVGKEAAGADRQDGTPVVVTAPGAVTGIDFALVQGGVISGYRRERTDRRAGDRHQCQ